MRTPRYTVHVSQGQVQVWLSPDTAPGPCATCDEHEAGRRIAAAPALLEALKEAAPYLDYLADNGSGNRDAARVASQIADAIAKFEGR